MKNRTSNIFSILLLCMCSSLSFAQFQLEGYLGANLGKDVTHILRKERHLDARHSRVKTGYGLGIAAAVSATYFFNPKWGISSGISFNQIAPVHTFAGSRASMVFNYLGIPLTAKYNLNKRIQFSFALQGHYLLDLWSVESGKIIRLSGYRPLFEEFGLSADAGINYYFSKFIIRAAYSPFLTGHAGKREQASITTRQQLHAFSLSLGYRFF